jgi:hypothetical protein
VIFVKPGGDYPEAVLIEVLLHPYACSEILKAVSDPTTGGTREHHIHQSSYGCAVEALR